MEDSSPVPMAVRVAPYVLIAGAIYGFAFGGSIFEFVLAAGCVLLAGLILRARRANRQERIASTPPELLRAEQLRRVNIGFFLMATPAVYIMYLGLRYSDPLYIVGGLALTGFAIAQTVLFRRALSQPVDEQTER